MLLVFVHAGLQPEPRGNLNSPQAACEGVVGAAATPRNSGKERGRARGEWDRQHFVVSLKGENVQTK